MEIREAEKRAAELRAVIEKHNHNYYDLDSPTIEDDEYDALMRERAALSSSSRSLPCRIPRRTGSAERSAAVLRR